MENEFRFFLNKEELSHGIRDCEHVGFFMYFFDLFKCIIFDFSLHGENELQDSK